MAITIKLIGAFRSISGTSELTIDLKDTKILGEVIKKIVAALPKLKHILIDPELKTSSPNTLIVINGTEISVLNGLETMLRDGDEVVFVPVLHGG